MLAVKRFTSGNTLPVGTVIHSRLTEAQFQAINGTSWVLYDNRSIAGSVLASVLGVTTLDDARGLFLRAKNNGRADGSQDPGGERALGNRQTQATRKNGLALSDPGHSHHSGLGGDGSTARYGLTAFPGGSAAVTVDWPSFVGVYTQGANTSSTTTGTTLGNGDAETRPTNIALNVFIKINP